MISLNILTVYYKVKNEFGRKGFHCVNQHPPIDGSHQFTELKLHSVSSDLSDRRVAVSAYMLGLAYLFLTAFFGGMVVLLYTVVYIEWMFIELRLTISVIPHVCFILV